MFFQILDWCERENTQDVNIKDDFPRVLQGWECWHRRHSIGEGLSHKTGRIVYESGNINTHYWHAVWLQYCSAVLSLQQDQLFCLDSIYHSVSILRKHPRQYQDVSTRQGIKKTSILNQVRVQCYYQKFINYCLFIIFRKKKIPIQTCAETRQSIQPRAKAAFSLSQFCNSPLYCARGIAWCTPWKPGDAREMPVRTRDCCKKSATTRCSRKIRTWLCCEYLSVSLRLLHKSYSNWQLFWGTNRRTLIITVSNYIYFFELVTYMFELFLVL